MGLLQSLFGMEIWRLPGGDGQVALIFVVLAILIVTGLVISALSLSSDEEESDSEISSEEFSGARDHRLKGRAEKSTNKSIKRRLILRTIEDDDFGQVGELVLKIVGRRFGGSFLRRFVSFGNSQLPFSIGTGYVDAAPHGPQSRVAETVLEGRLLGLSLQITFFPSGPLLQKEPAEFDQKALLPGYECFDFPLSALKGLTRNLSGVQELALSGAIAGLTSRGCGIKGQVVCGDVLARWAREIDDQVEGLRLTQPVLYHELLVVAGWCFLVSGLLAQDNILLTRSLSLYERARSFDWKGRDVTEWAGIKANEAMAAFALVQLGGSASMERVMIRAALDGLRHFRHEIFPFCEGKLMCLLALAKIEVSKDGSLGEVADGSLHEMADGSVKTLHFLTSQNGQSIDGALEKAIKYWRVIGDEASICQVHFARGHLAMKLAVQHSGLQNWERAENALLAALGLSNDDEVWFTSCRSDIRFALGKLYLARGSKLGEKGFLEKAIHHFTELIEGDRLTETRREAVAVALAHSYLHFGGTTNEADIHKKAISQFTHLREKYHGFERRREIDRALSVGRARLALTLRDRTEAKRAVAKISAVIGQRSSSWPSREVLLRLRARLREMLFLLEGDDVALDRAIKDRRELVENASDGLNDLGWAVEAGDLVGLLSRRRYKLSGQLQDFDEAHYLLQKSIAVCGSDEFKEGDGQRYLVPHIEASLNLRLGKLLASFARVKFDLSALNEAVAAFEWVLQLTPRSINPLDRAGVLNDVGQIMMDRSEHYGHHDGLRRAAHCFAEAHDIYMEAQRMAQANRMRRFLENAEAAFLAYQVTSY